MGLAVAVVVDGECAEWLAGGGVDDADVEVGDEQDDVGSSDADVVESAVDAQCDGAGCVDSVGSDAVVGDVGSVFS